MKIQLDDSPAKLEIVTPYGSVEIEIWPGTQTRVVVKPNDPATLTSSAILRPRS